jgi:hypothetical protein
MTHTHTITPISKSAQTGHCIEAKKVTKLADLPKLYVEYDKCTYSEGAVNTVPLEELKKSRDTINKKLRNYKRFAKKYGWEKDV